MTNIDITNTAFHSSIPPFYVFGNNGAVFSTNSFTLNAHTNTSVSTSANFITSFGQLYQTQFQLFGLDNNIYTTNGDYSLTYTSGLVKTYSSFPQIGVFVSTNVDPSGMIFLITFTNSTGGNVIIPSIIYGFAVFIYD